MEAPATEEKLLDTKQVAQILGCGYTRANQLMRSQNLKTVNLSSPTGTRKRLRVTRENLDKFIKQGGCIC